MTPDTLLLSQATTQAALWPYRPRPLPDEILISYLIRIADGLGLTPRRFLSSVWGSGLPLFYQDLDSFAPDHVIAALCRGTGTDAAAIEATTLRDLDGWLTSGYELRGRKTWILPTSIASGHRLRHGLQFCPMCLAAQGGPYLRRTWRLAFATVCTIHGNGLLDACPACGSILHPHRAPSLRHCFRCATDLARVSAPAAATQAVAWQAGLEKGLLEGGARLGEGLVWSQAVFAIVRQIAALFVNGPRASALRETTARLHGGDPRPFAKPSKRQPIEYLEIDERGRLFDLVQRIMADWPVRFVSVCDEALLYRSHAIKDMPEVPFAFESLLKRHLDRTPYQASDGEVEAAAHWLRRTEGVATYDALKRLCGESRAAIYAHMDYLRQPSTPSRYLVDAIASGRRRASRPPAPGTTTAMRNSDPEVPFPAPEGDMQLSRRRARCINRKIK